MKRFLAGLLIFLLLVLPAFAEERIDLSTPGSDNLTPYTLPDGRIIFAGSAGEKGDYQNRKARLVCLNSDGTIAWDYLHPAEGSCNFSNVHLLLDGQLGVVFKNSPDQTTVEAAIYKFSLDGEILAEPISIFTERMLLLDSTDACISYLVSSPEGQIASYHFVDWDGQQLFQLPADSIIGGGFQTLPADDGVLLIGNETGFPALGKLMKLDMAGNIVWSQTLEPSLPNANHANFSPVFPLRDGGFAVVLYEEVYDSSTPSASEGYLLRFDKEGSLLWKTSLQQSGIPEITMMDCIEYENCLVAAEDLSFGTEQVWKYDWFDLNTGALIKRTEQAMPDGITNYSSDFVVLDSGLWIQRNIRQNIKEDRLAELNSRDEVLIRVPER
ncbi:MAG: delta-60 repeat domain-containing protein [Clostridia bacterium]|nr:delta-60 repeat domain-containing protein [Clostridia bacterium]